MLATGLNGFSASLGAGGQLGGWAATRAGAMGPSEVLQTPSSSFHLIVLTRSEAMLFFLP